MSEATPAYPLCWPAGWRRTIAEQRERANFNKKVPQYRQVRGADGVMRPERSFDRATELSVSDATTRLLAELDRMGIDREDIVISTNIELRMDGLPKSNRRAPEDPGVAVYWRRGKDTRCMAIDRYVRVEDNLAAVAATLDAMRSIERHGGATILDRAFQGFVALPAPVAWWQILKLKGPDVTESEVVSAHRRLAMEHHPDRGGDAEQMANINRARDQGLEAL